MPSQTIFFWKVNVHRANGTGNNRPMPRAPTLSGSNPSIWIKMWSVWGWGWWGPKQFLAYGPKRLRPALHVQTSHPRSAASPHKFNI